MPAEMLGITLLSTKCPNLPWKGRESHKNQHLGAVCGWRSNAATGGTTLVLLKGQHLVGVTACLLETFYCFPPLRLERLRGRVSNA